MALLRQEDGESLTFCDAWRQAQSRRGDGPESPWRVANVPSSPQDAADFEWVMWFTTFRNHILFALAGHVIFAKIVTVVAPKVRGEPRTR